METPNMDTYVLTLSRTFPVKHPKAGEPTYFKEKIYNGGVLLSQALEYAMPANSKEPNVKRHTIRANYELWRKRFDKIERGEACLSIRQWTGKPYASKQIEIARLTKDDGIGLQKMEFLKYQEGFTGDGIWIAGHTFPSHQREWIANNDGLTLRDWEAWFKDYDKTKPLAIIHFTKFRY